MSGLRPLAAVAALIVGALACGPSALGQSPGAMAGGPPPKDTIFARKILMGAIDMNMDEVETMLGPDGKLDAAEAQEHVDNISIMLMSFPHLFPQVTNQWKAGAERDPATDTFASPDLWTNFADFYKRASDASKVAQNAAKTRKLAEFKELMTQLRIDCNECHAKYQKTE
jgi:cytochrome c556